MASEEPGQPVLLLALAQAHERFLQGDRAHRVVSGLRHVRHPVPVGFEFCTTAVTQERKLCRSRGAPDGQLAELAVAGHDSGRHDQDLPDCAARHLLCAVARRCVHHLVTQDRS